MVARDNSSYNYALLGILGLIILLGLVVLVVLDSPGTDIVGEAFSDLPQTGTIDFNGHTLPIFRITEDDEELRDLDIDSASITFRRKGGFHSLDLGETAAFPGTTLTLIKVQNKKAHLLVAPQAQACDQLDGQTPACRGNSACCDGTCTALPTCNGKPDGPITACGQRDLYCCNEQVSLHGCCDTDVGCMVDDICLADGDMNTAETHVCIARENGHELHTCNAASVGDLVLDEHDMAQHCCTRELVGMTNAIPPAPIYEYKFTDGDDPACIQPECTRASDCPVINCFVAPCPQYICVDNTCVLTNENPGEGIA